MIRFSVLSLVACLMATQSFAQTKGDVDGRPGGYPGYPGQPGGAYPSGPVAGSAMSQAIADLQYALQSMQSNITKGDQQIAGSLMTMATLTQQLASVSAYGQVDQMQGLIAALDQQAYQIYSSLSYRPANPAVTNAMYSLIKAVGGLKIAAMAPTPVIPPYPVVDLPPNAKPVKCALRFQNRYSSSFLVTADGYDNSSATAALYQACTTVGGTDGNVSNAQLGQQNIGNAKCFNVIDEVTQGNQPQGGFAACSMTFTNRYSSRFSVSGSGMNAAQALLQMWEQCKTIGGTDGNVTNAGVCAEAFVQRKYTCVIR